MYTRKNAVRTNTISNKIWVLAKNTKNHYERKKDKELVLKIGGIPFRHIKMPENDYCNLEKNSYYIRKAEKPRRYSQNCQAWREG